MKGPLYFDLDSERRVPDKFCILVKKKQIFQKYFPKYLKQFTHISRKHSVTSKVKRAKIIQDFGTFHQFSSSQDWRVLLGNKMKSVKVLSNSNQKPLQFSEKIKLFLGLQRITISMPERKPIQSTNGQDYFMEKACKQMKRLRKLKCLKVFQITQNCKNFLKKLNSLPKLLSSLKTLEISCEKKAASDPELLRIIIRNHNVIKSLTSLNLRGLCSNSHFQSFVLLANSCPNLLNLAFGFSCRNIEYNLYGSKCFANDCFQVNTGYLQALKNFQNLRVLNLDIADYFTFLKDFALPLSIQNLRLNFEEILSKEILKKLDPNFSNLNDSEIPQFFEQNKTLLKFYQNFQQLDRLGTLELVYNLDSSAKAYQHQNYLCQGFAKRTSSVKSLSLKFSPGLIGLFQDFGNIRGDANLALLFETCSSFANSLESLEIGNENVIFPQVDLSAFHGKFANLSSVKVKGMFHEPDRMKNKICLLLKEIGPLGENITTITACTFLGGTARTLLTLLRQVNRLNKLGKAKIELQVKSFKNQGLEDLKDGFTIPINDLKTGEGYQKARGVSLKLFTKIGSENMKEFLEIYGQKFESFEILPSHIQFQ